MPQKTSVMTKSKQRDVILHFWCEGVRNANEIHRRTNIGLSTIYYNLKKLEKTGDVARKPVSGRPRKITGSAVNVIGQQIRRNPQITRKGLVQKLEEKGIKVSKDTVGRHLQRQGYKNALPIATPMLTAEHKKKRVEWAKKHIDDDWSRTVFSDETSFQLFQNTITQWYKYQRPIRPFPKNRQKIHAWGGFSSCAKTSLYCFTGIMNAEFFVQILEEQLPEINEVMGDDWRLQMDNDPKHKSRLAKDFLQNNVPEVMDWPSNSPDLNPIENLWGLVKRNVEKRKPRNLDDLEEFMIEEWDLISDEIINNLVNSMRKRCEEVIKVNGERIKF
jgi:transposase